VKFDPSIPLSTSASIADADDADAVIRDTSYSGRRNFVLFFFFLLALAVLLRSIYLQAWEQDFFSSQGNMRQIRTLPLAAHRGLLLDRNNEPLAVSSPIHSVWADPQKLIEHEDRFDALGFFLEMDPKRLRQRVTAAATAGKEFVYLKRHVRPQIAKNIQQAKDRSQIEGINLQREYGRYYPSAEITAHLLGFTDIDGRGREGLEMNFNDWLDSTSGSHRVITDLLGDAIENVELIAAPQQGNDLILSIDKRIQYLAYRELQHAVLENGARSGSVVVLDSASGEVLAMVNYPSYNPNLFSSRGESGAMRNRAVTDVLEPGSTIKPFTIAAALDVGLLSVDHVVDTSPGRFNVGKYVVRDFSNYGELTLAGILEKSSNIGASKIALQMDRSELWSVFDRLGFGRPSVMEFPGAVSGFLAHASEWSVVRQATVSYGYGVSTTVLHLARAYSAIANDGVMPEISFQKLDEPPVTRRVFSTQVARQVRDMLRDVVTSGTGKKAAVPGYTVAGKTGTPHISENGSYADDRYISQFAGMAPAANPDLVAIVVVNEPLGKYFGGEVAAPVFANIVAGALRIRNVEPDLRTTDSGDQGSSDDSSVVASTSQ